MTVLNHDWVNPDDPTSGCCDDSNVGLRLSQRTPTLVPMTIAERVRQLIGQRGETQGAFAAEVGLEPTKLSKSLSGVRRFSSLDLALISEACEVTVDWLVTGEEPPLAAAARASAGSAAGAALVLARNYMTIRSDLVALGYPQGWRLPAPPSLGGLWKEQGAALAESAGAQLAAVGDLVTEPLPALIERAFGIDVAIKPLGDGFDGLAVATGDLKLILAAPQVVPARLRFTIAHELGHLLASDDQQIHTDQNIYRTDRVESEIRANAFAATLLMPEAVLRDKVGPGFDKEGFCRVATTLRVSPSALAIRLEGLRLIDAGTRDRWSRISGRDAANLAGLHVGNAQLAAESLSVRPPGLLLRDAWAAYEAGDVTLRLFAGLSGTTTDALRASLDLDEVDD